MQQLTNPGFFTLQCASESTPKCWLYQSLWGEPGTGGNLLHSAPRGKHPVENKACLLLIRSDVPYVHVQWTQYLTSAPTLSPGQARSPSRGHRASRRSRAACFASGSPDLSPQGTDPGGLALLPPAAPPTQPRLGPCGRCGAARPGLQWWRRGGHGHGGGYKRGRGAGSRGGQRRDRAR